MVVAVLALLRLAAQSRNQCPTHINPDRKVWRCSYRPNKTIRLPSFITALPFRFG
jgi:hypothetical protein